MKSNRQKILNKLYDLAGISNIVEESAIIEEIKTSSSTYEVEDEEVDMNPEFDSLYDLYL